MPGNGSFFLPDSTPRPSQRELFFEDILDALTLGIADYYEKNKVFKKIGVALSGGRDSLLTLLIAHRVASRINPENPGAILHAFTMPSRYSSTRNARRRRRSPRTSASRWRSCRSTRRTSGNWPPSNRCSAPGEQVTELTKQNIQARIRGQRMWNWSNSSGGLFLQTGNMSEKAVGYTTVGGDLEGALGVIANVPKTVVMALLDYLLEKTGHEGIARCWQARRSGAGAEPAGRVGADALPGPGCLLPPLRRARRCCPQEVELVLAEMFPEYPAEQIRAWVESSPGSSRSRSTSGCRRRSPCTSATWTWTASARCSCRWCRTGVGLRGRRF